MHLVSNLLASPASGDKWQDFSPSTPDLVSNLLASPASGDFLTSTNTSALPSISFQSISFPSEWGLLGKSTLF